MVVGMIFKVLGSVFKFLYTVDDIIRLFTMTLVGFLGMKLLGMSGILFWAIMLLCISIDLQDIIDDIQSGKPLDLGFN